MVRRHRSAGAVNPVCIRKGARFWANVLSVSILSAVSVAYGGEGQAPVHRYSLQPGWNLLGFSPAESGVAETVFQSKGWVFWRLPSGGSESTSAAGYWVWSSEEAEVRFQGSQPHAEATHSAVLDVGWHFVTQPQGYANRGEARAVRWNAQAQTFEPMLAGERFLPGQGYWIHLQETGGPVAGSEAVAAMQGESGGAPVAHLFPSSPTLLVFAPPGDVHHTQEDWALVGGEVSDEDLLGLYLNGVELSKKSRSFTELVTLRPGENQVKLVAVGKSGLRQEIHKTIIRDTRPPKIRLSFSESVARASQSTIRVWGEIEEDWLAGVSFNGQDLKPGHFFEQSIALDSLVVGLSTFNVRAWDHSGRESTAEFALYRTDEHGLALTDPTVENLPEREDSFGSKLELETPTITVMTPDAPVVYTAEPLVRIEGRAGGSMLRDVSVNGTLVAVDDGVFSFALRLFQASTEVEIIARGIDESQSTRTLQFVLDSESPKIILSHPSRVITYEPQYTLRGAVSEAHLAELSLTGGDSLKSDVPLVDGFFETTVALEEGENHFVLGASDRSGLQVEHEVIVSYGPGPQQLKRPASPLALSVMETGQAVRLWWKAPSLFEDGSPIPKGLNPSFRIYRDGHMLGETNDTRFEGTVAELDRHRHYFATAVMKNGAGAEVESVPSDPVALQSLSASVPVAPGDFEPPVLVTQGGRSKGLPKTALSNFEGKVVAHMAFATKGDGRDGDGVWYLRSAKAGKANSFSPSVRLAELDAHTQITDLALVAKEGQVALSWVEAQGGGGDGLSRVVVVQSRDGGRSFSKTQVVRENTEWKRGLDAEYDHSGHYHLVWGEASKVYYLYELSGVPSNVFDVRKKEPATEIVRYKAQYTPGPDGCHCEDCWCEESYPLSEEPNPEDEGRPFGPYIYRTEEALVYEPDLHVDGDKISIVARQLGMWDDKPVPNPAWEAMMKVPIYSADIVQKLRPTRMALGWRSAWKTAKEEGDEERLHTVGYEHQYLYQGTWFYQNAVKIAQRSLDGPWLKRQEATFLEEDGPNNVESSWRISVVSDGFDAAHSNQAAHPQVYTAPGGEMLAVFEKGASSEPSPVGDRALYTTSSRDGGLTWGPATFLASGTLPKMVVSSENEVSVLFRTVESDGEEPSGQIGVVQKGTGEAFGDPKIVNRMPAAMVRAQGVGRDVDALWDAPTISALDELVWVAWIREPTPFQPEKQIVSARASKETAFSHVDVSLPKKFTSAAGASMTISRENKYHMGLAQAGVVEVSTPIAAEVGSSDRPAGLRLESGVGHLAMSTGLEVMPATLSGVGSGGIAFTVGTPERPELRSFEFSTRAAFHSAVSNYDKAVELRDGLLRQAVEETTGKEFYYQVEYQLSEADQEALNQTAELLATVDSLKLQDAMYLAGFERVWAYTQGIALAQFSLSATGYEREARGLARYLCHHAVRKGGSREILGWPFSWNTKGDDWQDARLVTGANAWVIHGLGVFIGSPAYLQASHPDRANFKTCYHDALLGLRAHRQRLPDGNGKMVSLMTAGWTTDGLKNAHVPHHLRSSSSSDGGGVFQDFGDAHRLSYYSVLDAIGYNGFAPTQIRYCMMGPGQDCVGLSAGDPIWQDYALDSEAEWRVLKNRSKARNVVTEHNLDVLSVLNHALRNQDGLRPEGADATGDWARDIEAWRDEVRDGIFSFLWDDEGWRQEFADVLADLESGSSRQLTKKQTEARRERMRKMERAMDSHALGRVVTGGTLVDGTLGGFRFEPSEHTAIDNCSWLSLSVDHQGLVADSLTGDIPYIERLSQCLRYTVLQFVKELGVGSDGCNPEVSSCPPRRTYRGTHYFQNAFKDPYIEPSDLQESSYHLEATMGLILGLFRFAHAHPEHPDSADLLQEAQRLWAGAQSFVGDHGFIYSSQRIQDLSARLVSSTALVWFIDVHHDLERSDSDASRPLRPYDRVSDAARQSATLTASALEVFRASSKTWIESGVHASDGGPYTVLVDQALALIVTTNQSLEAESESLAKSLLAMHEDGFLLAVRPGATVPFDQTYGLEERLLGYYALAWYLDRLPGSTLRPQLESVLVDGFGSLLARQVSLDSGPLFGLFRRPEDASLAKLEDNVLGFFTLELISRLFQNKTPELRFAEHLESLRGALVALCGLSDGAPPARWAAQWGLDRSALDGGRAFKPCSLFASKIGARSAALGLFESAPSVVPADDGYPSERLDLWSMFGWLAQRALAVVDPRQDEIVRVALVEENRAVDSKSIGHAAAVLITDRPRGVFGVDVGPLTALSAGMDLLAMDAHDLGRIQRALADRFGDTFFALLLSEFRAYRFDALFLELVRIQKAYDEVFRTGGPRSYHERLVGMRHHLTEGLCEPSFLLHQGSIGLDQGMGLDCDEAMALTGHLFHARGVGGDDAWVLSLAGGDSTGWSALVEELLWPDASRGPLADGLDAGVHLGHDQGLAGHEPSRYSFLRRARGVDVGSGASPSEWRDALRRRMNAALESGLSQADPQTIVVYALGDVDPIHAFNPSSPHYWKQSALELRGVLSPTFRGRVRFRYRGVKADAPDFPLAPRNQGNAKFFRQWVNAYADGDLNVLADKSGVAPKDRASWLTSMHRMVRTGVMVQSEVDAWLEGMGLSTSAKAEWARLLETEPASSSGLQSWVVGGLNGAAFSDGGPWGALELASAPADTIRPVEDTSEDFGLAGEKWLLGTWTKTDATITPLETAQGDYAVFRGRHQCLFHIENRGTHEVRYQVTVDGEPFGPALTLPPVERGRAQEDAHNADVCGLIPERPGFEAEVIVKNLATGWDPTFVFPVRTTFGCQTGQSVAKEHAVSMIQSREWELDGYQSQDCGDALTLQPVSPTPEGMVRFPVHENGPLVIVSALRAARTAKTLVRAATSLKGSASAGLSTEQVLGTVVGAVGAGSIHGVSEEMKADLPGLFWRSLRLFEAPPKGPWMQVGWVSAWEVFAESEDFVRTLPIYNRNAQGSWAVFGAFEPGDLYGLVQPVVYAGPKLPLLDPSVPLFGHDITSKMAVFRYTANVALSTSDRRPRVEHSVTPLEAFLAETGGYPDWIYAFPPEFHYPIFMTLFVEPSLGEGGGARSTKSLSVNRPGIFRMDGEDVFLGNLVFQKQPSLPIELQRSDYVWGLWPGTDWHVYGPPSDVDAFVNQYAYSAQGPKKTTKKKGAEKSSTHSGTKLTPALGLLPKARMQRLTESLAVLLGRLEQHGPAYEFSDTLAPSLTGLEERLRGWTALGQVAQSESAPFDARLADLKKEIEEVRSKVDDGTLAVEGKSALVEVDGAVHAILLYTEGGVFYRGEKPMGRHAQVAAGKALNAYTGQVFSEEEKRHIAFELNPKDKEQEPTPDQRLVTVTYPVVAPFYKVDSFIRTVVVPKWVHETQTQNFYAMGGAWRREYSSAGEFIDILYFVEEELIRLGQKAPLTKDTLLPLVRQFLAMDSDSDAIAYVGPMDDVPKEARDWMLASKSVDGIKKGYYVVSILEGTVFIVVETRKKQNTVFKMNKYVFEGVTTDIVNWQLVKANAEKYVPEGQKTPWFLTDRYLNVKHYSPRGTRITAIEYEEQRGKPPAERKVEPDQKQTTPALNGNAGDLLRRALMTVQSLLKKNQKAYQMWPEAASWIFRMEPLLALLEKNPGVPRRDKDEFEFVVAHVLKRTEAILKRMGPGNKLAAFESSAIPEVVKHFVGFSTLVRQDMLYQGKTLGRLGNAWAALHQGHVVVLYVGRGSNLVVFPAGSKAAGEPSSWKLVAAQYFGKPKKDFSDVDKWVQKVLVPNWIVGATEHRFDVFGEGWTRRYQKSGQFVWSGSTLAGYTDSVLSTLDRSDVKTLLANAVGIDAEDIWQLSEDKMTKGVLLNKAKATHQVQYAIAVSRGFQPDLYVGFSGAVADAVTSQTMPHRLVGVATDEGGPGKDDPEVRNRLEEQAARYVPKEQTQSWFIATPLHTSQHGKGAKEEADKIVDGLPESVRKRLGPAGLEVLQKFPGRGEIVTASKKEIGPSALVAMAQKEKRPVNLIYVSSGPYWIAVASTNSIKTKGGPFARFGLFEYLGVGSDKWMGIGMVRSNLIGMAKSIMHEQQEGDWFLAAPDVLPPYRYTKEGQKIPDEPGVLRWFFQDKTRLNPNAVFDFWNRDAPTMAYVYSEKHGYVVFAEKDVAVWADLKTHDHRVLLYLGTPEGRNTRSAFTRLENQDYVFVATRGSDEVIRTEVHDLEGDVQTGAHPALDPWGKDDPEVDFLGVVLETPEGLKLAEDDILIASTLGTESWWREELTHWFKGLKRGKGLKLTDLELTVRGGVPHIARFHTPKGPLIIGWNTGLGAKEDAVRRLQEELANE